MKDQTVRRVLKDNKVPGTSTGTRVAEAPCQGAGSAAGFLGESQAGLCERPDACVDQGALNRKNFSERKRENTGTQRLVRELSAAALASCAPPPQPLDWEPWINSPSTHVKPGWCAPRSADWVPTDWVPTTETPGGRPHLTSGVCAHLDKRLAALAHRPKARDRPRNPINSLAAQGQPQLNHRF